MFCPWVFQITSEKASGPAYSLGGGADRLTAIQSRTRSVGPGPIYAPLVDKSTTLGVFSVGERSSVVRKAAVDVPGPKYDLRTTLDAPSATFAKAGLAKKQPDRIANKVLLGPPKGFGFGCSMEEHVKYGQCLDGLCCTRGTWEVGAVRATKLAESRAPSRKPSSSVRFDASTKAGTATDDAASEGSSVASEEPLPDRWAPACTCVLCSLDASTRVFLLSRV